MANFAYVENGQIIETCNELPVNWRNVSNLNALTNDEMLLNDLGWFKVIQEEDYDPSNYMIANSILSIVDGVVRESHQVVPKRAPATLEEVTSEKWFAVRQERDVKMNEFQWRYERYNRELRLGLPNTDNLEMLDNYMQALADITKQDDPFNINWPTF